MMLQIHHINKRLSIIIHHHLGKKESFAQKLIEYFVMKKLLIAIYDGKNGNSSLIR